MKSVQWTMRWCMLALWSLSAVCSWGALTAEKREELEGMIQAELQEKVNALLPLDVYCAKHLGLPWPLPEPTMSKADVLRAVDARVQEEALEKFPESKQADFEREAAALFRQYERGEEVTVTRQNGEKVKGRIRQLNRHDVLIDIHTIRYDALAKESFVHFDVNVAQLATEEYVRNKMDDWRRQRSDYAKQISAAREEMLFRAANYTRSLGVWVPLNEYAMKEHEAQQAALADRLRPLLRIRVYYQADYRLYQGVWLTRSEIKEREDAERKANEFPPAFEQELDALNAENAHSGASTTPPPATGGGADAPPAGLFD